MKLSNLFIANFLFATVLISSCSEDDDIATLNGTGNITSRTLNLKSFTEIEVTNHCDVEVVMGAENKVEFSDYDNLINFLEFEVVNDRLRIKTTPNTSIKDSKAKAKVYLTGNLSKVSILGVGDIDLLSPFVGLKQLELSGSGSLNANQNTAVSNITCTISGSGDMNILKINSTTANCKVSGVGDISISVSNSLDASISGVGNIYYQGNPTNVTKNITGVGKLIKL